MWVREKNGDFEEKALNQCRFKSLDTTIDVMFDSITQQSKRWNDINTENGFNVVLPHWFVLATHLLLDYDRDWIQRIFNYFSYIFCWNFVKLKTSSLKFLIFHVISQFYPWKNSSISHKKSINPISYNFTFHLIIFE